MWVIERLNLARLANPLEKSETLKIQTSDTISELGKLIKPSETSDIE